MKNRKERILLAMHVVLAEYREKNHYASIGYCSLCQQFYTDENTVERHHCHKCPMFVFHKPNSDELSCMERKCKPISCRENQKMTQGLKKVIEFYEKAIEGLEKLSNEDLAKKNVFQYLVDIDKEVQEKYRKNKKITEDSL